MQRVPLEHKRLQGLTPYTDERFSYIVLHKADARGGAHAAALPTVSTASAAAALAKERASALVGDGDLDTLEAPNRGVVEVSVEGAGLGRILRTPLKRKVFYRPRPPN